MQNCHFASKIVTIGSNKSQIDAISWRGEGVDVDQNICTAVKWLVETVSQLQGRTKRIITVENQATP